MPVSEEWERLTAELSRCRDCRPDILHDEARPLLGRFKPRERGALFVFEAPNFADTVDPDAGYITYDENMTPGATGEFTRELFTETLGMAPDDFQVTNAVLCLPRGAGTPSAEQVRRCGPNLRRQIETLDPGVVVTVGAVALDALRLIEHFDGSLTEVVSQVVAEGPRRWSRRRRDGVPRWLFPLYHTGARVRNRGTRTEDQQRADWARLRDFLAREGVWPASG